MDENSLSISPLVWFLIKAGIIVGSGGLIVGYNIGIIGGAMFDLDDEYDLGDLQRGLIVSLLSIGSMCGCLFGGYLSDKIGRKRTILIQDVIFVVGSLLLTFATSVPCLYVGRFVVGIAIAFASVANVPYLNEIAPSECRGRLSSMFEYMIVVGALFGSISSLLLSGAIYGWRVMFFVPTVLAGLQLLGMGLLPDSPQWLVQRLRFEDARDALLDMHSGDISAAQAAFDHLLEFSAPAVFAQMYASRMDSEERFFTGFSVKDVADNASSEIQDANISLARTRESSRVEPITEIVVGDKELANHISNSVDPYAELHKPQPRRVSRSISPQLQEFVLPDASVTSDSRHLGGAENDYRTARELLHFRVALIVIFIMMALGQFSGSVVIRNYAPTIFNQAGFSRVGSLQFNAVVSIVNLAVVSTSTCYVDRYGRCFLLIAGFVVTALGNAVLSIGFMSTRQTSTSQSDVAVFLCGCILTSAGFTMGFGPIGWVLSSEMFPTKIRGRALSISTLARNTFEFATNFLFLTMISELSEFGTFIVFFIACTIAIVFVLIGLVETKEIEPDEILAKLHMKIIWKHCASTQGSCSDSDEGHDNRYRLSSSLLYEPVNR